ncbi:hypothetical protein G6F22_020917 [Rhizopus arrhizus]|nr:hypothetical protein G6F22_020917 [Rhizopus arrhizus]
MDFGLTPAAVFAQRRAMGGWRIRSELVATNMGAEKFAHEIHLHLAQMYQGFHIGGFWGDPSGDNRAQSDETTPFQILKAANLPAVPAPTNDPLLRCGARLQDPAQGAGRRLLLSPPGRLWRAVR